MLKVSFLGDISLNNCYNQFYKKGVNPFESLTDLLENSDFNIGNLERGFGSPNEPLDGDVYRLGFKRLNL